MRSVVVTGGSRGLGLAMTETLAAAGYQVTAIARGMTEGLAAAIAAHPGTVRFESWDLSDTSSLGRLAAALRAHGPVYGLVNNAGLGTAGILSTMSESEIERLIRLNVISPLTLTKYLVRPMMTARAGRIVNVSSIVATTGYAGLSVYSATKAAMIGFTRSLAREVGQLGITVNAIAPGFVETEMTHGLTEPQRAQVRRRSALGRLPAAAEVAAAVDFLLSDRAAAITGTITTIDAGNTA